jgi:hypothetical protein
VFNKVEDLYPHFRFLHIDTLSNWNSVSPRSRSLLNGRSQMMILVIILCFD